jgi:AcrR family transcriptional regulator
MASSDNQQAEHIIQVASRLFSALGYDATSTTQIAEAAGVQPSAIEELFGGRQGLYVAVMKDAFEKESMVLQELLDELRCDDAADCARAIHLLIDRQFEFTISHPYIYALRTHRWLSDAIHVEEVRRYSLPILRTVMAAFEPAMAAGHLSEDADLEFLLFMTHWCIQGFTMGGVPDENGVMRTHTDEAEGRRFRLRLHQMVHRTLLLPGDYSPG